MESSGGGAAGLIVSLIYVAVAVLMIASLWKVFAKAGKPGWAAIIPIYNYVILLQIVNKPIWWIVLFCVPVVNFVIAILVMIELAKAFGKSAGFGIGLAFLGPIFLPMLAFGDAQYQGTGGAAPAAA